MLTSVSSDRKIVSDKDYAQFLSEGYFVLEAVIPKEDLEDLRSEVDRFVREMDTEMDQNSTDTLGITHRNSRYFVSAWRKSDKVRNFITSELMAGICHDILGENAYLVFEQYVVKAAEKGMKFAWHQDSGYLGYDHPPYLTCWCTLDDVNEDNGTVYVLPYERAGTRERVVHVREEGTNDLVGYFGEDPGVPVIAPAGSIAIFASTLFHRSGANTTDKMRRIYLPQYAAAPVMTSDGSAIANLAEPVLLNGVRQVPKPL